MRPIRSALLTCLVLQSEPLHAQQVRLTGRVVETASGTPIPMAWLDLVNDGRRIGVDSLGRFSVLLGRGTYVVGVHALGFASVQTALVVDADTALVFRLGPSPIELDAIEAVADRFELRTRPLQWAVRSISRAALASSRAKEPVDHLRGSLLQLYPCGGSECVRYREVLVVPLVCIDDRIALGGLTELRSHPSASLHTIEVHARGRMVRAYTARFMESVAPQATSSRRRYCDPISRPAEAGRVRVTRG